MKKDGAGGLTAGWCGETRTIVRLTNARGGGRSGRETRKLHGPEATGHAISSSTGAGGRAPNYYRRAPSIRRQAPGGVFRRVVVGGHAADTGFACVQLVVGGYVTHEDPDTRNDFRSVQYFFLVLKITRRLFALRFRCPMFFFFFKTME